MSDDDHQKRQRTEPTQLIWARDGDSDTAVCHPAYLLDNKKGDANLVWIEWASNGTVAQIPESCISSGLASRRSSRVDNVQTFQEIKVRRRDDVEKKRERKSKKRKGRTICMIEGCRTSATSLAKGKVCIRHGVRVFARKLCKTHQLIHYGSEKSKDVGVSSGLAPRSPEQPNMKEEIKIKEEQAYNYDTDDESSPSYPVAPPSPVVSASAMMGAEGNMHAAVVKVKE